MRVVVQRVLRARVSVEGRVSGEIGKGLLALVGFREEDGPEQYRYVTDKLVNLRIFEDPQGKMNLSLQDVGGGLLVVPNFTLYGDCRQGRRPSFTASSKPDTARHQFDAFCKGLEERFPELRTGEFQAEMAVELVNDGPVTLLLDSEKTF
ncbi:D-aminoacyl-tRNA deacylase [Anaerotalea alkaliphila]|uniref:D-aminoacyl-tRNA deacylase n=1 Tax=Anaerotalea alkaliphila TaxID=2662126 RepID=A0A7X5HTZ8_9FIRM|nr:D-aminoacyl-tRNA deacylase [Anaerotalea alkaliphila]NDL66630.1 D-tyrosyl-tRNA(Tyr) deacylase [Anaerotalea alkaliphila]